MERNLDRYELARLIDQVIQDNYGNLTELTIREALNMELCLYKH